MSVCRQADEFAVPSPVALARLWPAHLLEVSMVWTEAGLLLDCRWCDHTHATFPVCILVCNLIFVYVLF